MFDNDLQPLVIHMIPQAEVDARTSKTRYNHPETRGWFTTTQAWSWLGGDALVSLTGRTAYVTLRLGDKVYTQPGSIASALQSWGFNTSVVCEMFAD